jgi:hypothetical protein
MNKILLDVKPFQEKLNSSYCGPATMKIVLGYFGIDKSEDELAAMMGWSKNLGVDDNGFKKAAEYLGFKAEIKNENTFKDIEYWLKKRVPVVVDWFTRGRTDYTDSDVSDGHYSVVMGLDDKNIYLQDPEIGGMRTINREDFMRVWFDFTGEYIKPDELIIRQIIAIYK